MKKTLFYFLLFLSGNLIAQTNRYDLVIVGGTPGGIMAAISASREGKTSVILERSGYIGGLPANGLGATDIATRGATTGLFKEFVGHILNYYIQKYGKNSEQVKISSEGYHFEPHVASLVFEKMLEPERNNITILTNRQFDSSAKNVIMQEQTISAIKIYNRKTKKTEVYEGKVFIDATYEGDLGAAAGVPFSIGREGKDDYNEIGAGRLFKLWQGPELEGSTHEGDDAVQAYNYRLCLTNNPDNRTLPQKPENYNRKEYLSLIDDVYLGRHAGVKILEVTPQMQEENKQHILSGGITRIPDDPWGIAKITNMVDLPNMKTDANNQHMAFISTDLPEENWKWPTADWKWRDIYANRLKEYTLGLLWFAQNDNDLPEAFRNAVKEWGLAKDEYQDNNNFPRQVYVREGRRLHGEHIFTANDALPVTANSRPPVYKSSITSSHYALDSHAVRKREEGKLALDGFFSYSSAVYTVPFETILPKNVSNLLIPVPASATHVGYSTLRMEPCWMALGQAAGIAASVSIDKKTDLKKVKVEDIQQILIKEKATLFYLKDMDNNHPDWEVAQYMGIRGYLPDWEAKWEADLDKKTAERWNELSGIKINYEGKKRGNVLRGIYEIIR
ncbi:MAG: FAD-dependent oxidoreductase [Candidatus Azobacteroides sp.]|nr:FAD-dependent oxidoreductase [Candidatus Azobacteroides sp.]